MEFGRRTGSLIQFISIFACSQAKSLEEPLYDDEDDKPIDFETFQLLIDTVGQRLHVCAGKIVRST